MTEPRPAIFLDRDGTVIREKEYLADPEDVSLVPGVTGAIRDARNAGLAVVITTNQSGIARGLYDEDDYRAVARRLDELLEAEDAGVDGTYHCPHHPDFTGPCACRKPATGMFREAAGEHGIDLPASYWIGDRVKDVLPALILGGEGYLVRTGYGAEEEDYVPGKITVVDDAPEAVERAVSDARSAVDRPRASG